MNTRTRLGIIIAAIGLVLVAIGGFAVYQLFTRPDIGAEPIEAEPEEATSQVVVAARFLQLGDYIQSEDVMLVERPISVVPEGTLTNLDDAVGKYIKTDVTMGEMILQHNVAKPTKVYQDIAFTLADDHVLMAFPAKDLISTLSVPQRGDIIDIFVTMTEEVEIVDEDAPYAESEETETTTITFNTFQRLNITALVADVVQEEEEQTTFTTREGDEEQEAKPTPVPSQTNIQAYLLALDPQDALILKHLKDVGAMIDFVIRAPTSDIDFELEPVTSEYLKELYGLEVLK